GTGTEGNNDEDGGGAWRTRDALTAILGSEASVVLSESGLTSVEMSMLAAEGRPNNQNHQLEAGSALMVPIASILAPLLPAKRNDAVQQPRSSNDDNEGGNQQRRLNSEHVRRAFDAAAFAVVRGNQRANQRAARAMAVASASPTTNAAANIVSNDADTKMTIESTNDQKHYYDPPLLVAMEAIRTARIANLEEASGKSAPPFLKKNNSIPWFHLPVATAAAAAGKGGGGGTSSSPSSSSSLVAAGSSTMSAGTGQSGKGCGSDGNNKSKLVQGSGKIDTVKVKKEQQNTTNKKRKNPSSDDVVFGKTGNETVKSKRVKQEKGDAALPAAGTKEKDIDDVRGKKDKKVGDTQTKKSKASIAKKATSPSSRRILTPSSSTSSKQSLLSPIIKPKKLAGTPGRPSYAEGISALSNNATVSRAIISAAAAGVFQELNPDYDDGDDDNNATAVEISKITSGDSLLLGTSAKVKNADLGKATTIKSPPTKSTKKEVVDMDQVVAQAKRLGNRVLDHSKGAARRGDQRREFRMDGALSRVGGTGASSTFFQNGHRGGGNGGLLTMGAGESAQKVMVGNPFLVSPAHTLPLVIPNCFVKMNNAGSDVDNLGDFKGVTMNSQFNNGGLAQGPMVVPSNELNDNAEWSESCLPRLLAILGKGAGHAVLHDMQWRERSYRVANLLQNMAISSCSSGQPSLNESTRGYPNYGPHLIVTSSGDDFAKFAAVFGQLGHGLSSVSRTSTGSYPTNAKDVMLRVLPYHGSKACRRQLRKHFGCLFPSPKSHFSTLGGLPESPFHVILTSYSALFEDYAHFCQIPFQVVLLDDGMSWLGCSHFDPNGKIGKIWNSGLWSNFDHGSGRAGVVDGVGQNSTWDFSKDVVGFEADGKPGSTKEKNGWKKLQIGLTARHRILLASNMHAQYRGQVYKAPVLGLLSHLAPQFSEAIRDDWERSKVFSCKRSMAYIRTMIARLVVVYSGDSTALGLNDLVSISLKSLDGELPLCPLNNHSAAQEDEGLDKLIKSQKIVHSRKFAVAWFRPSSSIRKELGIISLDPILSAVKKVTAGGFVCEEVVTSSSMTTSGASGSVVGLSAYRAAVRCGRCFSSEQGLKHHIATSHAPPGTWLCRSCGGDCGTGQARSHHERTCRAPKGTSIQSSIGGANPSSVGKGTRASRGPKKKVVKNPAKPERAKPEKAKPDKQSAEHVDGSTRVPGYKGVWAQNSGKYFVKVDDKPLVDNHSTSETPLLFDTAELAAKKFDEIFTERGEAKELEMNYKSDGSRVAGKEDSAAAVVPSAKTSGFDANITTPDLSVIDIKKLPLHVKPLLRDPNQTSRTGGNSKRYVYAYRGVCRQQRKGHDRWQSQISFNGQNHYLGTFDSEWDAAAVYSWAHLILYGEDETKKAQLEGEEAAAAFEQQQKDIAEGKIPPPSPKPVKKKKRGAPKKTPQKADTGKRSIRDKPKEESKANTPPETKIDGLVQETSASVHGKKKRPASLKEWNKLKTECAMMLSSGTKGTSRATILGTRKDIADKSEKLLLHSISGSISGPLSSV
ncbi:hypothetical protein ACHAXR_007024, partial [Thalassiosira sp. AJA248-18]